MVDFFFVGQLFIAPELMDKLPESELKPLLLTHTGQRWQPNKIVRSEVDSSMGRVQIVSIPNHVTFIELSHRVFKITRRRGAIGIRWE